MNILNLLVKSYSKLHNYPGIPYWLLTPTRKLVRYIADRILPGYLIKQPNEQVARNSGVIVSFTSFPARINKVWQVVECMKRQTYKPFKIILWLSKEQFPTYDSIPDSLKCREDSIFEIRMVDGDIRSHKKYYYVLNCFPDSLVFLIDDDLYYPTDLIEKTLVEYNKHSDHIICNYGFHIRYDDEGSILPYKEWKRSYKHSDESDLFFGSGGGTLLKSSLLHSDVTNLVLALDMTPIADDIWLNAMTRLAKTPIIILDNGHLLPISIDKNVKLASENVYQSKNDEQLNRIITYYRTKMGVDPFCRLIK